MSTGATIAIIVVAVIVLALLGWFVWTQSRRRQLRERFGTEYDRTVQERESRSAAERELAEREQRHAKLDIKPLSSLCGPAGGRGVPGRPHDRAGPVRGGAGAGGAAAARAGLTSRKKGYPPANG
jgi:hypothetical protein